MIDYFPLKLALGEHFCNREDERNFLKNNIAKCRHTVLVSPRRYGKSSLVHQVVADLKMPMGAVDLFLAHDDKTVGRRILQGVAMAVAQVVPAKAKFLGLIQDFFQNFKITLGAENFNIEVSYNANTAAVDTVEHIFGALQGLTKLAKDKKQRILLFIDEFQDIASINNPKAIQGAIRNVAQATSDVVFMFSGSNRHLLLELFDDKSMPLYMLCDKLNLQRMSSQSYWPHIQKAAKSRWKREIAQPVFERIMNYTELHPFYVNMLCNELWLSNNPPKVEDVLQAWFKCFENEERRLVAELEKLTVNQQNLLKALALNPIMEPTGQQFLTTANMPYSTVRQTIRALREKDMVYKVAPGQEDAIMYGLEQNQLRVLDPLLAFALRKYQ